VVNDPEVRWSSDVQSADWLVQRLTTGQLVVGAVVPTGFAGYVRLLHPAHTPDGTRVRWASLAARAQRALAPSTSFAAIQRDSGWQGDLPREGSLPADEVDALAGVLASFTATPQRCWFGVWDGYGWLYPDRSVSRLARSGAAAPPPLPGSTAPETAPRVRAPNRDYLLYTGPLKAVNALLVPPWSQSPNLWWPDDHTWCVGSEIDLDSTYVGGPSPLVDRLLADPRFEAVTVQPTDLLATVDDAPADSR
jgi:hypothetical protein